MRRATWLGSGVFVAVAFLTPISHATTPAVARGSGAASVNQSGGFQCGSGMSYKMDGGQAKCAVAIVAAPTGAACAPQLNFASGACRFDVPGAPNGGTVSAPNKTGGYTGSVSMTCSSGTWGGTSVTCVPDPCLAFATVSGSCAYSIPGAASGATSSGTNTTPGFTGTASATCTAGAWSVVSATCVPAGPPPCAGTMRSSSGCNFSFPATADGATSTVATFTAGYTGTMSLLCNSGAWVSMGPGTCAPAAPTPCTGTTISSGACVYNVPGAASGATSSGTNTTAGFTGTGTLSCSSGTWSPVSATCVPVPVGTPCTATTTSSGSCSYSIPGTASGSNSSGSNTTGGFTGTATLLCTNGAWSPVSATCTPAAVLPPCAAGPAVYGACSYWMPATPDGSGAAVPTTTLGYTGSMNQLCSSGAWLFGSATCTSATPTPCIATSTNFGSCSYSLPGVADGASAPVLTTTPGFTGGITGTCSGGGWSFSGATCTFVSPTPCAATLKTSGFCSYPVPGAADGASVTTTTTTVGFTGSITGICNSGSWSFGVGGCNPDLPCSTNIQTPTPGSWSCGSAAGSGAPFNIPATWSTGMYTFTMETCSNSPDVGKVMWHNAASVCAPPLGLCAATGGLRVAQRTASCASVASSPDRIFHGVSFGHVVGTVTYFEDICPTSPMFGKPDSSNGSTACTPF